MKLRITESEIERLIATSVNLATSTNVDKQIQALIAPMRSPLTGALDGLVADIQKQMRFQEHILRPFRISEELNRSLSRSLASILPAATPSFLESMREHETRLAHFAANTVRAQKESLRLLDSIKVDIASSLPAGIAASSLQREVGRLTMSLKELSAPGAASLAATLDGIRSTLLDEARRTQAALANATIATLRASEFAASAMSRTDDPIRIAALERSIGLSAVQFRSNVAIFSLYPVGETGPASIPPRHRRLLMPNRQRIELLQRRRIVSELDLDAVPALLPSAQTQALARELLTLIAQIDGLRMERGEPAIFSATQRIRDIVGQLPFALAVDRTTFAGLIDDLYLLLYEGGGSDNLRFHTRHGGPLDDDACDIIFVIRRMRHYFRHDPERGKDAERQQRRRVDDLRRRGFQGLPTTAGEFRELHRLFLEEVVAFARSLLASL